MSRREQRVLFDAYWGFPWSHFDPDSGSDFEDREWSQFKTGPGKYSFSSFHANSHITYSSFILSEFFICRDQPTRGRKRPAPFPGNHRYFFLYICLLFMALNVGFSFFMLIRIHLRGAGYGAEEIGSRSGQHLGKPSSFSVRPDLCAASMALFILCLSSSILVFLVSP